MKSSIDEYIKKATLRKDEISWIFFFEMKKNLLKTEYCDKESFLLCMIAQKKMLWKTLFKILKNESFFTNFLMIKWWQRGSNVCCWWLPMLTSRSCKIARFSMLKSSMIKEMNISFFLIISNQNAKKKVSKFEN